MLVFPIRRCPVSRMWLPARTRASRTRNSDSRSTKSSPLTQRPVASLMIPSVVDNATVVTVFDINCVVNEIDANGRDRGGGRVRPRAAESSSEHPRDCIRGRLKRRPRFRAGAGRAGPKAKDLRMRPAVSRASCGDHAVRGECASVPLQVEFPLRIRSQKRRQCAGRSSMSAETAVMRASRCGPASNCATSWRPGHRRRTASAR